MRIIEKVTSRINCHRTLHFRVWSMKCYHWSLILQPYLSIYWARLTCGENCAVLGIWDQGKGLCLGSLTLTRDNGKKVDFSEA